jgi:glycosyltransferase involved in cell wall biosynthesis
VTVRLVFVVNVDWMFVSHRLAIAKAAAAAGYDVHLVTSVTADTTGLSRAGVTVHSIGMDRTSSDVMGSLRLVWQLYGIFRRLKPDVVHLVTIKPVLFGGVAARLAGIPKVVVAISGLGFVFIRQGWKASIRRALVLCVYRIALKSRRVVVIVQNPADRAFIGEMAVVSPDRVRLIAGSGVDLQQFSVAPQPSGVPVALLPARLIVEKGIHEFVEAARMLARRGLKARFCLVGAIERSHPAGIPANIVESWVAEGLIEYWGHRPDMPTVLSLATVVVLPSYREGMPKALLEAAACGRAVITCDVPGCREAIEPGKTGMLVPARDPLSLADAMAAMIRDPELCHEMGRAGRARAERLFDVEDVVRRHLDIYRENAAPAPPG